MVDLPDSVPVFRTSDANLAYACAIRAGKYYNVSPYLVQTLLKVEGGVKGSKVRNTNGTYDYGPMQINTIWINELKRMQNINVPEERLINDVCYNIHIGTWILSNKIHEVGGDIWRGVGNYHSKTPRYHNRYLGNAKKAYSELITYWSNSLGVKTSQKSMDKIVDAYSASTKGVTNKRNTIQYSIAP